MCFVTGKEILKKELESLFNNRVNVGSETCCRVYDVVVAFLTQLREARLPVQGVYFVGSRLTDLLATPTHSNDIDLKVVLSGGVENAAQLISLAETALCVTLNEMSVSFDKFFRTLKALNISSFKPVFLPNLYSFKGYTISAPSGFLPFEISIFVMDNSHALPSVMNIDSLFIPIKLYDSCLGTFAPERFSVVSSQGEIDFVIKNIRDRVLSAQTPHLITKNGWSRYLMAITDGFLCLDPSINRAFYELESLKGSEVIYEFNQFVQKKRPKISSFYWEAFLCNALFNIPQTESLYIHLSTHFGDLVHRMRQDSFWMHFLHAIIPDSFSKNAFLPLLKLVLPLFAQKVSFKIHLEKPCIQCEIQKDGVSLYVMVPFFTELDVEFFPEVISLFLREDISIPLCFKEASLTFEGPFPAIFEGLCLIDTPLTQDIVLGWVSLFPYLLPFLLANGKAVSMFSSEKFSLLKARLLLESMKKGCFCWKELSLLLPASHISCLTKEEKSIFISHFLEKKEGLVACFLTNPIEIFQTESSPLDLILQVLPLCENEDKPRVACFAIKQILTAYSSQILEMPLVTWEKCQRIVHLVKEHVKNKTPWNHFFRSFVSYWLSLKTDSQEPHFSFPSLFIAEVFSLVDFSIVEEFSSSECLFLSSLEQIKNTPLSFRCAATALKKASLEKTELCLKQSILKDCFDLLGILEGFVLENRLDEVLILVSLAKDRLTGKERLSFFCRALKRLGVCSIDKIRKFLAEEDDKLKCAFGVYAFFYDVDKVASYLEAEYFLKPESYVGLLDIQREIDADSLNQYKRAFICRMEKNYQLALPLASLQEDSERIVDILFGLFIQSLNQPEKALEIVRFVATHFGGALRIEFLDSLVPFEQGLYSHRLVTEFSSFWSYDILERYSLLFVEQFEDLLAGNRSKVLSQVEEYLPLLSKKSCFLLAEKCALISSAESLFPRVLSLLSKEDLISNWELNKWTRKSLFCWINTLLEKKMFLDEYKGLFLSYIKNMTEQVLDSKDPELVMQYFFLVGESKYKTLFFEDSGYLDVLMEVMRESIKLNPLSLLVFQKGTEVLGGLKTEDSSVISLRNNLVDLFAKFDQVDLTKVKVSSLAALLEHLVCYSDVTVLRKRDWNFLSTALDALLTIDPKSFLGVNVAHWLRVLSAKMRDVPKGSYGEDLFMVTVSSKTILYLFQNDQTVSRESAIELFLYVHMYRLISQSCVFPEIEFKASFKFLEETVGDIFVQQKGGAGCLFSLCLAIKNHKKVRELTEGLLTSCLSICKKPFENNLHACAAVSPILEIFAGNRYGMPIPAKFNNPGTVSEFLSFSLKNLGDDHNQFCLFFKSISPIFISYRLDEKLVLGILEKGLNIVNRLVKESNFRFIDFVSNILLTSYLLSSDYVSAGGYKKVRKNLVLSMLDRLISFENIDVVDMALNGILAKLLSSSLLKEAFFLDLIEGLSRVRQKSIGETYAEVFMYRAFCQVIDWRMVVLTMQKIDVSSWSQRDVDCLTMIFCTVIDFQFVVRMKDPYKEEPLSSLLNLYLRLIERSSQAFLPINLIRDVVQNPQNYFESKDSMHRAQVLIKVADRIALVSYNPQDERDGKVGNLIALYRSFYEELSPVQKTEFDSVYRQITKDT